MQDTRLVLASGSSTRAALLRQAGVSFEQRPARVDEQEWRHSLKAEGLATEDAATLIAEMKARSAARGSDLAQTLILGVDQILEFDDEWLEKPADTAAARNQLERLRGREHRLVSAAVVLRSGERVWHHVEGVRVLIRPFGNDFLDNYLERAGGAIIGSVGAYQLDDLGAQLVTRIEGDFFSVLGLPLLPLLQCLREQGFLPS